MNLRETYNTIGEDWFKDHNADTWWHSGTDVLLSLLAPGSRVLDVGCGAGTATKYLRSQGLDASGIDFSVTLLEIARREVPDALFSLLDIVDINILPGTYDAVFMKAVLLHVPRAEAQERIEEIAKKIKTGGYFYIAVKEKHDGIEEEIKKENDYGREYERFFSYYTLPEIVQYCTQVGLKVVYENIADVGHTRWVQVIAQK